MPDDQLIKALGDNTTAIMGLTTLLHRLIDEPEDTLLLWAIVAASGGLNGRETDELLEIVRRNLRKERDRLSDEEIALRPRGALISFPRAKGMAGKLKLHTSVPQFLWNALGSDELAKQLAAYNSQVNQRDKVVLRTIEGAYCSEDLKRLRELLELSVVNVRNLMQPGNQTWRLFTALAELES